MLSFEFLKILQWIRNQRQKKKATDTNFCYSEITSEISYKF